MMKAVPLVATCERLATSLEAVKIVSMTPMANKEWLEQIGKSDDEVKRLALKTGEPGT